MICGLEKDLRSRKDLRRRNKRHCLKNDIEAMNVFTYAYYFFFYFYFSRKVERVLVCND